MNLVESYSRDTVRSRLKNHNDDALYSRGHDTEMDNCSLCVLDGSSHVNQSIMQSDDEIDDYMINASSNWLIPICTCNDLIIQ